MTGPASIASGGEAVKITPQERAMTLAQLVGNAHQEVLNAPREKDENDKRAMRLLEIAYARILGER